MKCGVRLGQCLQKGTRPNDLVYRYGGEEFLIYLTGATLEEANMICDRLRQGIGILCFSGPAQSRFQVMISFSIAVVQKGLSIDEVTARSDLAFYNAKRAGCNRVCY
ncbi:MAG: hypothetical protein FD153_1383 [Rhodospirillaceae bacterium]|nr:MAG: hypothetical protein FD153_1383 [Rhodospirillaceae bacterium]